MKLFLSWVPYFALMAMVSVVLWPLADCYDPLDPNGNITVTFDIHDYTDDGYLARVTIENYYNYRHVDKPGWSLGWTWQDNEVIWLMSGAFATEQGDCGNIKHQIPHCCKKDPVISDQPVDALLENRSEDCCRDGLLSARAIDPSKSFSSFEMKAGNLKYGTTAKQPLNLTFMAPGPGYTCSPLLETLPTRSSYIGGRREVQVYRTWKSTCTYSNFLAYRSPICCVSFSTFYSRTITPCPTCSCGCKEGNQNAVSCIRESYPGYSDAKSLSNFDIVQCTDHMCPIRVHWHVKNNYVDQWRVKLTISNYNYNKSYSDWNVVVQHPGFTESIITYSFNSTKLPMVGYADEIALFWGLEFYNKELLNAEIDQLGSVTTDVLLRKDLKKFTLRDGWALPRVLSFNGESCQMPPVDIFPRLPNGSSRYKPTSSCFLLILIFLTFTIIMTWF